MILLKYYFCLSGSLAENDFVYLASAIDNDGCICARIVLQKESIGVRIDCEVQISQKTTRRNYLESFQKQVNFGYIRDRAGGMSDWVVSNDPDIEQLLTAILPYLKIKKNQAELMLKILSVYRKLPKANTTQRRIERAEGVFSILSDVDKLSSLNDSSNRKNTGELAFETMKNRNLLQGKTYKSP